MTSRLLMSAGMLVLTLGGCPSEKSPKVQDRPRPAAPPPPHSAPTPPRPAAAPADLQVAAAPPAPAPAAPAPGPQQAAPRQAEESESGLGVVIASRLNVRSGPKVTPDPVLGTVRCGDIVAIKGVGGEDKDWFQIRTETIGDGYSYSTYLARLHPGSRRPLCESLKKRKPEKKEPDKKEPDKKDTEQADQPLQPKIGSNPQLAADTGKGGPAAPETSPGQQAILAGKGPVQPTIILDKTGNRGLVTFPHGSASHQHYPCFRCHHPVAMQGGSLTRADKGTEANTQKNCLSCHGAGGQAAAKVNNQRAFHDTCIDCHRVEGHGPAPTACPQCHKK